MITIIKRGTLERTKCENCGCEFSYEEEDIQSDSIYTVNSIINGSSYTVQCPQCDTLVVVKSTR